MAKGELMGRRNDQAPAPLEVEFGLAALGAMHWEVREQFVCDVLATAVTNELIDALAAALREIDPAEAGLTILAGLAEAKRREDQAFAARVHELGDRLDERPDIEGNGRR
jgi:hypothetical protein